MSRRLIKTINGTSHCVRMVRDTEWNEYRVVLLKEEGAEEISTYHTDDMDDAHSTAQVMLNAAEAAHAAEQNEAENNTPNSWKQVEVTIDAETLINLLAATARYQDTAEGESDADLADMKASSFTAQSRWMDAVRASGIA